MKSKATGATGTAGKATPAWVCTSARACRRERPAFEHPEFDYENRIVLVTLPSATIASVYVPNGGKDFEAKMRFLAPLEQFVADRRDGTTPLSSAAI